MKKLLLITSLSIFIISSAISQIIQKPAAPVKKNAIIKTVPSQPAPAPAANTVTYYLTAARVSIVTGNDNKEQPSRASIGLNRTSGGEWPSDDKTAACGLFNYNYSTRILNEYRVNSVTEIPLITYYQFPYTFPGGVGEGWRYINLLLSSIQSHGLTLYVNYDPNFILDAWKIERVTLTLEFKDMNGNAHPTLGKVVIPFLNSSALLNDRNRTLKLETDQFLMPKN